MTAAAERQQLTDDLSVLLGRHRWLAGLQVRGVDGPRGYWTKAAQLNAVYADLGWAPDSQAPVRPAIAVSTLTLIVRDGAVGTPAQRRSAWAQARALLRAHQHDSWAEQLIGQVAVFSTRGVRLQASV